MTSHHGFPLGHHHTRVTDASTLVSHAASAWTLRAEQLDESEMNAMGMSGLIGLGATLGIVHVLTGPDHMTARAQLSCGKSFKGFWLGVRWGLGHSTGLLVM